MFRIGLSQAEQFVDDLKILERVNLLLVGLGSHSYKTAFRSNITVHTLKNKELNKKAENEPESGETKVMIFNFTV